MPPLFFRKYALFYIQKGGIIKEMTVYHSSWDLIDHLQKNYFDVVVLLSPAGDLGIGLVWDNL